MSSDLYPHLFISFLLAVALIFVLRQVSYNLHLIDLPDNRKQHVGAIPLCGGLAIFGAFMSGSIGIDREFEIPGPWEAGLAMILLLGLADDRWKLSAGTRLLVEVCAAIVLVAAAGAGPLNLGNLTGDGSWHPSVSIATALIVVFVVGMVNAVNMMDGLDGLAGSSVAASLFWLALAAAHTGEEAVSMHALVLLAAVVGFLAFNLRHPWRRQASVFMGDAGSMVLGAALATFVVYLARGDDGFAFPTLLWIVIVPVADTLSLMLRRVCARRSPFSADRWHLHHLFVDGGMSPDKATALISAAAAICGGIGYFGLIFRVPDPVMALGLVVPLGVHSLVVCALRGRLPALRSLTLAISPAPVSPPSIYTDKP